MFPNIYGEELNTRIRLLIRVYWKYFDRYPESLIVPINVTRVRYKQQLNSEQRQTDGRPSSGSAASPYSGLDYNNPANPYLWLNAATNPAAAASLGIFSIEKMSKMSQKCIFQLKKFILCPKMISIGHYNFLKKVSYVIILSKIFLKMKVIFSLKNCSHYF